MPGHDRTSGHRTKPPFIQQTPGGLQVDQRQDIFSQYQINGQMFGRNRQHGRRHALRQAQPFGPGAPGELPRFRPFAMGDMHQSAVQHYELFVGLNRSVAQQPASARGLVKAAIWVTVLSWSFYPVVFFAGAVGLEGATALTVVQVGYTIADLVAKADFGVLIFMIAVRKSEADMGRGSKA